MGGTLQRGGCTGLRLAVLLGLAISTASALDYSTLMKSVEPDRKARYEVFTNFQIKGICGTARLDLAARFGANTIRTYTPPSREQLDEYQRLGFKVIVGIWMPHQGENAGKWNYDYREKGDEQVKALEETIRQIGDHPAILLWCFGNEVHLDQPYLQTVNRMSELLHQKHPKQLSSLTMINAPKDKIALIKQHAPDLDVIGYNSYGHGAVGGASKNLEAAWGRAYYVSEFGPQGPWWGRKTAWGQIYEQTYDAKLADLRQSFAKIDAAPKCLGSTMFLWGYWSEQLPTYFSAFLCPDGTAKQVEEQKLYVTPMAEEFCHYWSGQYPQQRAPILTNLSVAGLKTGSDATVKAGNRFEVTAAASPGTAKAPLQYCWWLLNKRGEAVVGPVNTDEPSASLQAPKESGSEYSLMAYVIGPDQRASGFTIPIKVEKTGDATAPPEPSDHGL
jgi:hypothetical protein